MSHARQARLRQIAALEQRKAALCAEVERLTGEIRILEHLDAYAQEKLSEASGSGVNPQPPPDQPAPISRIRP